MKKVLITGSTGYLGRHLKRFASNLDWEVYESNTKIGNLMEESNLSVYDSLKFDYIFHLAAHTKAGDYCLYHKGEQFEINQRINSNILKYWRNKQSQAKMIAMGTSCSYDPMLPLTEDYYLSGIPESSLFTYAMTKRMLLVGLKAYAEQYGLKYMYYIPSTLYGPLFNLDDSHFIFDLIKKIEAGKRLGQKVELWGDGYQKRELIYIDDAINMMLNTLHLENEAINVSSGVEYSIREYAKLICDAIGYNENAVIYDTSRYVGVRSKRVPADKIKSILEDHSFTSLESGLNTTIQYYLSQVK